MLHIISNVFIRSVTLRFGTFLRFCPYVFIQQPSCVVRMLLLLLLGWWCGMVLLALVRCYGCVMRLLGFTSSYRILNLSS